MAHPSNPNNNPLLKIIDATDSLDAQKQWQSFAEQGTIKIVDQHMQITETLETGRRINIALWYIWKE